MAAWRLVMELIGLIIREKCVRALSVAMEASVQDV